MCFVLLGCDGLLLASPARGDEIGRVRAVVPRGVVSNAIAIIDGGAHASAKSVLAGEGDFVLIGICDCLNIIVAFDVLPFIGRRNTHGRFNVGLDPVVSFLGGWAERARCQRHHRRE